MNSIKLRNWIEPVLRHNACSEMLLSEEYRAKLSGKMSYKMLDDVLGSDS